MTAPRVPQGPPDWQAQHMDAGAYVLGLLDETDRLAFEEHLAGCPQCTVEVAELGGLEPLLAEFAAGETGVSAMAGPSPRLLDGVLTEVATARRRRRTRRLWLVAAAAVLIVGGPTVTAAVVDTGSSPAVTQSAGVLHSATGPGGVSATVGVTDKGWGSAITLKLDGITGPRDCDLVAVSNEGQRQTVTSWNIAATGYAQTAKELQTTGGAGFHAADISHFEVRDLADNQLLVSIPAS